MCASNVSNVIYHKFSHGAAFYAKNVNVILEYNLQCKTSKLLYFGCTFSFLMIYYFIFVQCFFFVFFLW